MKKFLENSLIPAYIVMAFIDWTYWLYRAYDLGLKDPNWEGFWTIVLIFGWVAGLLWPFHVAIELWGWILG